MPVGVVKTERDEKKWEQAKEIVAKQGKAGSWGLVMRIYQQLSKSQDEKLVGGKADGKPDSDFDPDSLKAGIKEEMEHTDDPEIAKEIAEDHLIGDPAYYKKLRRMEQQEKSMSKSMMEDLDDLVKSAEQEDTLCKADQLGFAGIGGGGTGKKGEGSRGGHIIGHRKGGQPIYQKEGGPPAAKPGTARFQREKAKAAKQGQNSHQAAAEKHMALMDEHDKALKNLPPKRVMQDDAHKEVREAHGKAYMAHKNAAIAHGNASGSGSKEDAAHAAKLSKEAMKASDKAHEMHSRTDEAHGTPWHPGQPLPSRAPTEGPDDKALREHHAREGALHQKLAEGHAKAAEVHGMPYGLQNEHKRLAEEHKNIGSYHESAATGRGNTKSIAIANTSDRWKAETAKVLQQHTKPLPPTFHESERPKAGASEVEHSNHHHGMAEAHAHSAARHYLHGRMVEGDKHARAAQAHSSASIRFGEAGGGRFVRGAYGPFTTKTQAHEAAAKAHKATDDAYDPDVKKSLQDRENTGDVLSKTMVTKEGKELHFAQVEAAIRRSGKAADHAAAAAKVYRQAGGTPGEHQKRGGKKRLKKGTRLSPEPMCKSDDPGEILVKDGLLLMTDGEDERLSKAVEDGSVGLGLSPTIARLSLLPAMEDCSDVAFPEGPTDRQTGTDGNGGLEEWWKDLDLGRAEVVLPAEEPKEYAVEETDPFVLEQQLRDKIRNS
jgi:hypothetical protein